MKYIGTFLAGFICAAILSWLVILPKETKVQFDHGFTNGVVQGHFDAIDAIQKEFGICESNIPSKHIFGTYSEAVSIETNGIKTIRVKP